MSAPLAASRARLLALGDPARLELVVALGAGGPTTAVRLAAERPVTRQAIEKQLAILDAAGLVASERRGRERWWSLDAEALNETGEALQDAARSWDRALERLRSYAEGSGP